MCAKYRLKYSHKVDGKAMFPCFHGNSVTNVIYEYILPQRTFVPNMNLKYFRVVELLLNMKLLPHTIRNFYSICYKETATFNTKRRSSLLDF